MNKLNYGIRRESRPALVHRPNMNRIIAQGEDRAKQLRSGMAVTVTLDDGSEREATVESMPWQLGHGQWVVGLSFMRGGYDVLRVKPKA